MRVWAEAGWLRLGVFWACAIGSIASGACSTRADAQGGAPGAPVPYKLGTFEESGRIFVGLVLDDRLVVDLVRANDAWERETAGAARVVIPAEMKALIERAAEPAVRDRLAAIARRAAAPGARPSYVRERQALRTRPPIMYPTTILNAAVNYTEHAEEMAGRGTPAPAPAPPESIPGVWERKPGDTRWNPYLFLKPPAVVIGDGDAIELPPGRDKIDWECELAVVVGRAARRVPVERASEFIFGYTIEVDVSDRGGRGDGRFGSDWLVGKGHDTFAPLGPFIVPKEFVKNPQELALRYTLNGRVMQDSNTARMTHTVYEMVSYASHILTLRPGDVISMGSPAGVGAGRATPIYFKPGDVGVCTYEGVGALTNPVRESAAAVAAEPRRPRARAD
jgi:2-keto-4-pentenoate hydratase/2-oxohepta-3-ene-1,7-dioic acid hydratase in catechol pathway